MGKVYKFNENEIEDIVKMYVEDFESTNNIAKKYKVDVSVITKRLKDNGVRIAKGSPYSKKYWIERGMVENEINSHIKTLRPVNKEFWLKRGYSEEETISQIEGQKLVSLRGCVARFGIDEGTRVWNERELKRSECGKKGNTNIDYWLNKGFSLEESKEKLSERQSTFSKEKCIKKHGEEMGLKIFNERQNKWQKSLYRNGNLKSGYSKVSQELFYKILKEYIPKEFGYINFALHNGEYSLSSVNSFYRYDFTDLKNMKIIEYNGDDYHGNPKKYLAEDTPHPFRKDITAKEMWDKDKIKLKIAKENGFDVLTIWDSDYKKNKIRVLNECLKFLNK